MVDGDGAGFGHGKGHQWTLFAWIYAQFGLGRAGRSACGEWRSTVQWCMRKVQGMLRLLKRIGHCPRGDSGSVHIVSFGADERWGECQGPHRGGGGEELGGVLVARLYALEWGPAATVRGAGFCIWLGHGLICTGQKNTCGLSWGNTCGLSWGNVVNKKGF